MTTYQMPAADSNVTVLSGTSEWNDRTRRTGPPGPAAGRPACSGEYAAGGRLRGALLADRELGQLEAKSGRDAGSLEAGVMFTLKKVFLWARVRVGPASEKT
jgi:hypothetical protein